MVRHDLDRDLQTRLDVCVRVQMTIATHRDHVEVGHPIDRLPESNNLCDSTEDAMNSPHRRRRHRRLARRRRLHRHRHCGRRRVDRRRCSRLQKRPAFK